MIGTRDRYTRALSARRPFALYRFNALGTFCSANDLPRCVRNTQQVNRIHTAHAIAWRTGKVKILLFRGYESVGRAKVQTFDDTAHRDIDVQRKISPRTCVFVFVRYFCFGAVQPTGKNYFSLFFSLNWKFSKQLQYTLQADVQGVSLTKIKLLVSQLVEMQVYRRWWASVTGINIGQLINLCELDFNLSI
jgi:hypothetical protein